MGMPRIEPGVLGEKQLYGFCAMQTPLQRQKLSQKIVQP